ncbi:MAG: hypothetical protein M3419_10945 [Actinomycetota bacterium]|nr:hypothetical protein [Actinomycetota bacterium]
MTSTRIPSGVARTRGSHSDPTRVGQARPSQLVTTTGVAAVADLPSRRVVVHGLGAWAVERQETIHEPRLLAEVRRNKRACIPARFTMVSRPDISPTSPTWSTLSPRVTITCASCEARRGITDACGQPLRLMVLGASSLGSR